MRSLKFTIPISIFMWGFYFLIFSFYHSDGDILKNQFGDETVGNLLNSIFVTIIFYSSILLSYSYIYSKRDRLKNKLFIVYGLIGSAFFTWIFFKLEVPFHWLFLTPIFILLFLLFYKLAFRSFRFLEGMILSYSIILFLTNADDDGTKLSWFIRILYLMTSKANENSLPFFFVPIIIGFLFYYFSNDKEKPIKKMKQKPVKPSQLPKEKPKPKDDFKDLF